MKDETTKPVEWTGGDVARAACFSFMIGAILMGALMSCSYRRIAIDNNAARWTINEKTGERQFEWTGRATP